MSGSFMDVYTPTDPASVDVPAAGLSPTIHVAGNDRMGTIILNVQSHSPELKLKLPFLKISSTTLLPGGSHSKAEFFGVELGTEANSPGKTYVWDYGIIREISE